MSTWQQHKQQDHKHFAGWLLISILLLFLLVGCGGPASSNGSTATPRATATSRPRPTPTPSQSALVTPTPSKVIPSSRPTPTSQPPPSPCDTPPGVQPVSSAEIAIGNTGRARIALTFDAGGPAAPASRILDILAQHHVHSTIFLTGDWANQNPDLVRRIHNEGHENANHTMNHPDLRTLSDQDVCTQLTRADQVISNLTGVTTRPYYRPPYGSRDARVRSLAAQIGYRTVYWSTDTLDWQASATSTSITNIVMSNLKNGAIILMHAGSQVESETLDGLMTRIEQQGYQMVTVSQVL
jgi:peptidoglycan/xylan/chitin deacetylase (PgdA/CDA1 family)